MRSRQNELRQHTQRREWTCWRVPGGPWKKQRPGVPLSRVFAGGRCGVHPRAIFLIIPGFINYFPEDKLSFRQSPWAEKSGQAIDTPLWILHMSLQSRAECRNTSETNWAVERHATRGAVGRISDSLAQVPVWEADPRGLRRWHAATTPTEVFQRVRSVSSIDTSLRIPIEDSQACADQQNSFGTSCREERHPTRGPCSCISD